MGFGHGLILKPIIVVREMDFANWPGVQGGINFIQTQQLGRRRWGLIIQGKSRCRHQKRGNRCWADRKDIDNLHQLCYYP